MNNIPGGVILIGENNEQFQEMLKAAKFALSESYHDVYNFIPITATYQVVNGIIYDMELCVQLIKNTFGIIQHFKILKRGKNYLILENNIIHGKI